MDRIRTLRKKKGLTQERLAEVLNVKHSAVSKYERGEIQPSQDILIRLSEVLDCSTDYLLEKIDTTYPKPIYIKSAPGEPFIDLDKLPQDAQDKIVEYYQMMVEKHLKKD